MLPCDSAFCLLPASVSSFVHNAAGPWTGLFCQGRVDQWFCTSQDFDSFIPPVQHSTGFAIDAPNKQAGTWHMWRLAHWCVCWVLLGVPVSAPHTAAMAGRRTDQQHHMSTHVWNGTLTLASLVKSTASVSQQLPTTPFHAADSSSPNDNIHQSSMFSQHHHISPSTHMPLSIVHSSIEHTWMRSSSRTSTSRPRGKAVPLRR
mmetsp:Transcript_31426/g.91158  ORF Transcript_31426/g.91158 Transcript_31426/m.91158 type:complete len:203 (-) Transcript_31426:167-775(-)